MLFVNSPGSDGRRAFITELTPAKQKACRETTAGFTGVEGNKLNDALNALLSKYEMKVIDLRAILGLGSKGDKALVRPLLISLEANFKNCEMIEGLQQTTKNRLKNLRLDINNLFGEYGIPIQPAGGPFDPKTPGATR